MEFRQIFGNLIAEADASKDPFGNDDVLPFPAPKDPHPHDDPPRMVCFHLLPHSEEQFGVPVVLFLASLSAGGQGRR